MGSFAPGCYGVPSIFSFKSQTCMACASFETCRIESHCELQEALAIGGDAVRNALLEYERAAHDSEPQTTTGIPGARTKPRDKRAKRPRFDLTNRQQMMVSSASKNVAKRLERLFRTGCDVVIRRAIRERDYDFVEIGNQRSLRLALQMLVRDGVTKRGLKAAFVGVLGWSDTSSQSEATIMWGLLPRLEIADIDNESLVLSPKAKAENYD